ncbi:myosin heavy chain, clone 203-like [Takifugu flavidus]|uniref:myosin heavy chain, clone 203-like n=1 Tax=Takifugu flavidus TaxID=433684 RepID=UPI0025443A86|nr:myosin heavy chain, clone 203-like [Takifugu flavidus]
MQEEREALQASHCEQLGSLRLQFDEQMEQMKLEHSQKTLNQRRQDNQLKQDLEKTTKDRWDMSRREEETIKETSDKALKTGQAARPAQEQLEKRVGQLEKEYKHLASSLEMEMDKMKAANAQERVTSRKKMGSSLHLEDNEQALIHLQKVRSFLEGELCNVSGGKAKNEHEETVEKMQRLQQEIKKEKEEKNGLRKEKKQLKKKIEQLEQRIEQLEKRAEHLDNFPVNPLQCYPSNVPSGVCNLHFGQSSGDINSYREALKVNSTKSWWDKHKRAL